VTALTAALGRVAADGRYAGRPLMAMIPVQDGNEVVEAFLVLGPCPGCYPHVDSMVAHIGSQGLPIHTRSFDTAAEAFAYAIERTGVGNRRPPPARTGLTRRTGRPCSEQGRPALPVRCSRTSR
jgi:hypothetical protein